MNICEQCDSSSQHSVSIQSESSRLTAAFSSTWFPPRLRLWLGSQSRYLHRLFRRRHLLPQGSSLDCFRDSRHRPLACSSSSESCGGRNRTCDEALNRRPPVPAQDPPQESVRTAGFEPAIFYTQNRRITKLCYTLNL